MKIIFDLTAGKSTSILFLNQAFL